MCLLIKSHTELKHPMLAFVLRYTSSRSKNVLPIITYTPMEESTSYPGYYEDPNWGHWGTLPKKGSGTSSGMFHTIVDGIVAADSLENDWAPSFVPPEDDNLYYLKMFLIEIPPQKIYEGIHMDCSSHLDFHNGIGCRFYKIITEMPTSWMHKLPGGGFYYHVSTNPAFKSKVLIQRPFNHAEFVSIEKLEQDSSLEAGQILSMVQHDQSKFYSRFNKIYKGELQNA